MTCLRSRLMLTLACAFVLVAATGVYAQDSPYLRWTILVNEGLQAENGITFDVFGQRPELSVRVTFMNDETAEPLSLPPVFLEALKLEWQQDNQPVPLAIEWQRVDLVTTNGDSIPASIGVTQLLQPQERVEFTGVLRKEVGEFQLGEHRLTLNLASAIRTLRSSTGAPWQGRYVESDAVIIRVVEPRTASDLRRKRMFDGQRAMGRNDYAGALGAYQEVLRDNPSDNDARTGVGQAYMNLGRFREAIAELERVLPYLKDRSAVPGWLAFSYLSVGDIAKAEAMLMSAHGADAAKRELQDLRAAGAR